MAVKKLKKISVAPIKYTSVKEKDLNAGVDEILKSAGIKAENLNSDDKNAQKMQKDNNLTTQNVNVGNVEENRTEEKTTTIPTTLDELLSSLQDIEDKFVGVTDADYIPESEKIKIPDSLNLEKLEVPEIDEDKIRDEVSEGEKNLAESEKNKAKFESESKQNAIKGEIEQLKASAVEDKKAIQEIYDEYKVQVENDAIKRGLARSSVALLQMDNVEASRAEALSEVATSLTKAITDAESEIVALQQELEITLNNLDLELASKINEKIAEKIESLDKKRAEAVEFNNKVNKMEAEYQQEMFGKMDEIQKMEAELQAKYEGVANEDKAGQKLDVALAYFASMDKTDALRVIINSPELARALGKGYYDLYYYVMRR